MYNLFIIVYRLTINIIGIILTYVIKVFFAFKVTRVSLLKILMITRFNLNREN